MSISKKTKKCLDCDKLVTNKSLRCAVCAKLSNKRNRFTDKALEYKEYKAADIVYVEYTESNMVLLTAYQKEFSTQMRYNRDKFMCILDKLQATISAYTLDPMVYDANQNTNTITITRNTVINMPRINQ